MRFDAVSRLSRFRSAGVLIGWLAACAAGAAPVMEFVPPAPGSYRLERIQQATDGAVLDAGGRRRRLSEFTRGRVTLLAFMYASCADPNGCPYALAVMHLVQDELEKLPQVRGRVGFVSLSFDPVRDTPQAIALYGRDHSGRDHGERDHSGDDHSKRDAGGVAEHLAWEFLTTRSRRELLPILDGFGQDVGVDIDRASGKALGSYSHVLKVFLIDRQGAVREIYTTAYLLPAMVLNDIKTLLMEDGVRFK